MGNSHAPLTRPQAVLVSRPLSTLDLPQRPRLWLTNVKVEHNAITKPAAGLSQPLALEKAVLAAVEA